MHLNTWHIFTHVHIPSMIAEANIGRILIKKSTIWVYISIMSLYLHHYMYIISTISPSRYVHVNIVVACHAARTSKGYQPTSPMVQARCRPDSGQVQAGFRPGAAGQVQLSGNRPTWQDSGQYLHACNALEHMTYIHTCTHTWHDSEGQHSPYFDHT